MRHYRYPTPAERDERAEKRQAAALAARLEGIASRDVGPRDDMRQPWPLVLGEWTRWEVRPYRRNVRQWWAVDQVTGEPVRDARGLIVHCGIDELVRLAAKPLPRRCMGQRRAIE